MVTITECAAKEINGLVEKQSAEESQEPKKMYLRVGVRGGGCSGFSYTLDLTEDVGENDEVWPQHGIDVVCDSKSALYLDGTTVDFKDELMGRGFVFSNPNASSSCGCGSSFSV